VNKQDIIRAIQAGELDADLDTLKYDLVNAIINRFANRPAQVFKAGQPVRFNGYFSPQYMQGRVAEVVEYGSYKSVVKLSGTVGKFRGEQPFVVFTKTMDRV
jgi:hypothetical protein